MQTSYRTFILLECFYYFIKNKYLILMILKLSVLTINTFWNLYWNCSKMFFYRQSTIYCWTCHLSSSCRVTRCTCATSVKYLSSSGWVRWKKNFSLSRTCSTATCSLLRKLLTTFVSTYFICTAFLLLNSDTWSYFLV